MYNISYRPKETCHTEEVYYMLYIKNNNNNISKTLTDLSSTHTMKKCIIL